MLEPAEFEELQSAMAALAQASQAADGKTEDGSSAIEWRIFVNRDRGVVYGPYPYLQYRSGDRHKICYLKGYSGPPPPQIVERCRQIAREMPSPQDLLAEEPDFAPMAAPKPHHSPGASRPTSSEISPGMEVEVASCSSYSNRYRGHRGIVLDVIPGGILPSVAPLARVALGGASTDYVFRQDCLVPVVSNMESPARAPEHDH